jgi:hypothetical protein
VPAGTEPPPTDVKTPTSPEPNGGTAREATIPDSNLPPEVAGFDFSTEASRKQAIANYTTCWTRADWSCPEAALARTAVVDPGDLCKWKKGFPTADRSDKAKRIEDALTNNSSPTRKVKQSVAPKHSKIANVGG